MNKTKKIFTSFQVILVIICIILTIVAINPKIDAHGLAIRGVEKNSSAAIAGMQAPGANIRPTAREVVETINNIPVNDLKSYYDFTATLTPNRTFTIKTNKNIYRLTALGKYNDTVLNKTVDEKYIEEMFDSDTNTSYNVTKYRKVPVVKHELIGVQDLGLNLYPAPSTNLKKGLDLSGGSRIVLKPKTLISQDDMDLTIASINQRLNVFGLSDVSVRPASNFQGNEQYIIIEIAGTTKEELSNLAQQGNFEAKIGNKTSFKGGKDVTYVCRTADCSGIDPQRGCSQATEGGYVCSFRFSISVTAEAAERQAEITRDIDVVVEQNQNYLAQSLDLYLDNELVDTLRIGSELKGNPVTQISISGSGTGPSTQAATADALNNMKRLQAILATGSLPTQLEIVKADNISPALGEEFVQNALMMGLASLIIVILIVFLRYRSFVVSLPMIVTMLSELFIFLGIAAVIGWNIDVAAVAGIIVSIGTGVNDQILIADETLKNKRTEKVKNWKEKIKNAFFIIFTSYLTVVVAMIPLWFAGAGLLKGFAVTTILGVTVGVLITRPAYAKVVEILSEKEN